MAEPGDPLSEREQDILRLVATGATNRQIAQELSISPNTVKVHLRNVFTKLEISSRTEATLVAIREGWVGVREGEKPGEVEADAAQPAGPWVSEPFVAPLRPLPWFKRVALVASLALVVAVMALAQPRAVAVPAEVCGDEFTAACVSEENGLVVEEPESVWVSLATMPEARGRFALVATGTTLYVVGGETTGGVTGSLAIYDLEANVWRAGAPKPTAVANLAAVVYEDLIYALGGRNQAGEPIAVVEVYDPATDSWSEGVALPRPVMAHAAVAAGDRILVFGGSDGAGYSGLAWAWEAGEGRWRVLPMSGRWPAGTFARADACWSCIVGNRRRVAPSTTRRRSLRGESCISGWR